MTQNGIIRFIPITMEYFDKEENQLGSMGISGSMIVAIISIDRINNVAMVSSEGSEPIAIALGGASVFRYGPIYYPVVEKQNNDGSISLAYEYIPIELKLWKFLIDNNLDNVRIEFDGSENIVSSIALKRPPIIPVLSVVYKIKTILQDDFGLNIDGYGIEEYSTREEAQAALQEVAKKTISNLDSKLKAYFQIEEVIKRKEYEKEIH